MNSGIYRRVCRHCGDTFFTRSPNQLYCFRECQRESKAGVSETMVNILGVLAANDCEWMRISGKTVLLMADRIVPLVEYRDGMARITEKGLEEWQRRSFATTR